MKRAWLGIVGVSMMCISGLLMGGCGSGSSTGSATGETMDAPAPDSRSMATSFSSVATELRNQGQSGALVAESLDQFIQADSLMADLKKYTRDFPGTGRATYSKQIGGLTVTLNTTVVNARRTDYTITLNGSVAETGNAYNNFVWSTGTVTLSQLNGKTGYRQDGMYYSLREGGQSEVTVTAQNWFFRDGSGQGYHQFSNGRYTTYRFTAGEVWNWAAYTGGNDQTGTLQAEAVIQADRSGSAKVYCDTDRAVRAEAMWTGAQAGTVCAFPTACGDREGCRDFSGERRQ